MMERIELKIINTELRTIVEQKNCFIQLYSDYLFFQISYTSHEPKNYDSPEIKEDIIFFNYLFMDRGFISSMDFYLSHQHKRFKLTINTNNESVGIYYDDWKEARDVLFKIKNWKYPEK